MKTTFLTLRNVLIVILLIVCAAFLFVAAMQIGQQLPGIHWQQVVSIGWNG
jgi:uncharacterized protein YxeA